MQDDLREKMNLDLPELNLQLNTNEFENPDDTIMSLLISSAMRASNPTPVVQNTIVPDESARRFCLPS